MTALVGALLGALLTDELLRERDLARVSRLQIVLGLPVVGLVALAWLVPALEPWCIPPWTFFAGALFFSFWMLHDYQSEQRRSRWTL